MKPEIKSLCKTIIKLPIFWICVTACLLLFTLLSKQEFWTGYDTYFHMNAIYEDAMQIKTGHFSYFLSLFGFDRSGRIVNALYSPILSYVLGGILLLGRSWVHFEFITFFVTLVIAGAGTYTCARRLRITKPIATVTALLFMMSEPVSLQWIRNFEFTGLGGMILLPFVLLVGIKIVQRRQIRVLPLAILMAICLQVHLMTSVIAVLSLLPFVIVSWALSSHKLRMVVKGCESALLAFILSGNVFGAIYDVYTTNHLIPTFPNFHLQRPMLDGALFVQGHYIVGMGRLYTLLLVIVIVGMLIQFRHVTWIDGCLLIDDLFMIWISSVYFPWGQLLRIVPDLAVIVQYPVRFMTLPFITTLLLLSRLMMTLSKRPRHATDLLLVIILILATWLPISNEHFLSRGWCSPRVVQYWVHPSAAKKSGFEIQRDSNRLRSAFRSYDLAKGINVAHKVTTDYLPTTSKLNIYNYYHWPTGATYIKDFRNQHKYHKFIRDYELNMTWRNRNTRQVQVPFVKYGNTVVTLNHRHVSPRTSVVGTMNVKPRKGRNVMSIRYQPGQIFKFLSMITVLAWLLVIGILVRLKIKSK